jgi:hypothetical protein
MAMSAAEHAAGVLLPLQRRTRQALQLSLGATLGMIKLSYSNTLCNWKKEEKERLGCFQTNERQKVRAHNAFFKKEG